jgi:hypothetical protein
MVADMANLSRISITEYRYRRAYHASAVMRPMVAPWLERPPFQM